MALHDELPDFWRQPTPGQRTIELTREADGWHLTGVKDAFASPIEAYDFGDEGLHANVHFEPHVFEGFGDIHDPLGMVGVPRPEQPGTSRMISSTNSLQEDRADAIEAYQEFLHNRYNYLAEQDDFYTAYQFVRSHPYFWNTWGNRARKDEILGWEYELLPDDLHLSIYQDDNNKIVFLLETGPYTGENGARNEHTLDTRLVCTGPSYEAALLKLAAQLEATVDVTGAEREPVRIP